MVACRVRERSDGSCHQVREYPDDGAADSDWESGNLLHEGALADCYAFIRLRDRGCI